MRVLITGGAGFIGSHLADDLVAHGHQVRVLDDLVPQIHAGRQRPAYLHDGIELVRGDVRDASIVRRALLGIDAVYHLAARVGVGQGMHQMADYTSANAFGTAALLAEIIERPVERFVVASSMSLYGEGLYVDDRGALVPDAERHAAQLRDRQWEPTTTDGRSLQPVPTPESTPVRLTNVYALTKFDQERLALLVGGAHGIPTVALRFFNVYGPRQTAANPYTGMLSVFAARLLDGEAPVVFEDGQQRRDFVSVFDAVRACRLALERPAADVAGRTFNVGSGVSHSVLDVARLMSRALGVERDPEVTHQHRPGDVRHCFADVTAAQTALGFEPRVSLEAGVQQFAQWYAAQPVDGERPHERGSLSRVG